MDQAQREVAEAREMLIREDQLKRRTGAQKGRDEETLGILEKALDSLHSAKSNESELARRYAVTVTELEKVIAYFGIYVVGGP